jgi:predicted XRE-type DNA-binding protein
MIRREHKAGGLAGRLPKARKGFLPDNSGNVFADLELDDADELLTRAQLGHTVRVILKARKLKQREIARLLDIDQAEVSKLMNGQYHLFAEGRLFTFLKRLERKVTIRVSRHRKGEPYQQVTFAS